MDKLKQEFLLGFKEGWSAFWSPFSGLHQSISATWRRHITMPQDNRRRHA